MFKRLQSSPNVLAYKVSGKITAGDVDAVYDDLAEAWKEHEKLSFYAEMLGEFDFEAAAAWRDLTRAHEVLGHFRDFDRIALVVEPSWVAAIVKFEKAILSLFNFEMQVFDPAEKARALAWVSGDIEDPNKPSIREIPSPIPNIAVFEVDGKIRKSDMIVAKDMMLKFLDEDQPRNLMAIIKDLAGFELGLLLDTDLYRLKIEAAKHLDKYAIVGAPNWLEGYIDTLDALLQPQIRTFDADEQDSALAWLVEEESAA